MSRISRYFYALSSGLLLSIPWMEWGSGFVLFIAFVPLLLIENYFFRNKQKYKSVQVFLFSLIVFSLWNGIATWWIWNATPVGMFMAIFLNTVWMSTVFWIFHVSRRSLGSSNGYLALIFFWIAYEYLQLNWQLDWPWLNLGNGFAKDIRFIQWYEYTGILGGSFWVLMVNILIMIIIQKQLRFRTFHSYLPELIFALIWIFFPALYSNHTYNHYRELENKKQIAVLQPNIDPYTEKFSNLSQDDQLDIIINLADSVADDSIALYVAPETALPNTLWEHQFELTRERRKLLIFLSKYKGAGFITGLTSAKRYETSEKPTPSARKYKGKDLYYDVYNAAVCVHPPFKDQFYHKSKLVAGVEKMPFAKYLGFLEDLILDLGGTTGSLGSQDEPSVFHFFDTVIVAAPVICYESVFGEWVSRYVQKGANMIFVITNDGWWGNTPGYKQHLHYSQLRAIETRRSVVRSANTGISAFIDQRGNILKQSQWWKRDVLVAGVNTNSKITFYVKHGDFLGRIFSFFTVLLLLTLGVNLILKRTGKKQN